MLLFNIHLCGGGVVPIFYLWKCVSLLGYTIYTALPIICFHVDHLTPWAVTRFGDCDVVPGPPLSPPLLGIRGVGRMPPLCIGAMSPCRTCDAITWRRHVVTWSSTSAHIFRRAWTPLFWRTYGHQWRDSLSFLWAAHGVRDRSCYSIGYTAIHIVHSNFIISILNFTFYTLTFTFPSLCYGLTSSILLLFF